VRKENLVIRMGAKIEYIVGGFVMDEVVWRRIIVGAIVGL